MEVHPLANVFPMMSSSEIDELAADIRENGLHEPVWLYGGRVIDGRNRLEACARANVEVRIREFLGAADELLPFVISLNLRRRHLSESQRGMVAANLANMPLGGAVYRSANLQTEIAPVTQSDAADMLNVSARTVAAAVKVKNEAPPEVVQAVQAGEMSVSLAAEVVELPAEDRAAIAAAPVEQMRDLARDVVKRAHVANNSGNNEWYTPAEYIMRARQVMGGIDLDPASSEVANRTVGATTFYTAEDDGLSKPWYGRVWMNPPYAQPLMAQFADAVADKFSEREIEQACVLVNNATETQWFQRLMRSASAVCFPQGRIRFIDPEGKPSGAPLQGQAILYFGSNLQEFAGAFNSLGQVLWTVGEVDLAEAADEF